MSVLTKIGAQQEAEDEALARALDAAAPSTETLPGMVGISPAALETWKSLASTLVKSALLPRHIKSAPDALVIMMAGEELGIPPLKALRGIHMVEGKPELSADTMLGLCKRAGYKVRWQKSDDREAVLQLVDPRDPDFPHTETYSMKMAADAGLVTKQNWRKYPVAMLKARCVSAAVRAFCPEILSSCYIEGEISDRPEAVMDSHTNMQTQGAIALAEVNMNAASQSGDDRRIEHAQQKYREAVQAREDAMDPSVQEDEREAERALIDEWKNILQSEVLSEEDLFQWCEEEGGRFCRCVFYREEAWEAVKACVKAINEVEERVKGKDWITAQSVKDALRAAPAVEPDMSEDEETDVDLGAMR